MSLGIVIANIAEPVRQLPVNQSHGPIPASVVPDAAPGPGSAPRAAAVVPAITTNASQLGPNFTVVVLQLLNEQGMVTSTIPSAQQLAAYRAGTATPPD